MVPVSCLSVFIVRLALAFMICAKAARAPIASCRTAHHRRRWPLFAALIRFERFQAVVLKSARISLSDTFRPLLSPIVCSAAGPFH